MDAHAHLLSLGWAGPGHSLDSKPQRGRRGLAYDPKTVTSANTGNGLVTPLLISQKRNTFGVGKKAHEPAAGNEWWLKGLEAALSNIGKSGSERTSGAATPNPGGSKTRFGGKQEGLYGFFVKGQEMVGTIDTSKIDAEQRGTKTKRKSDALEENISEPSDQEDQKRKQPPKSKSTDDVAEFEQVGAFIGTRDRDEKRRRRKSRAIELVEFQQVGEFFQVAADMKRKTHGAEAQVNLIQPLSGTAPSAGEEVSKEERRRQRKAEKAAKRARQNGAEAAQSESLRRKEERKRWKERG